MNSNIVLVAGLPNDPCIVPILSALKRRGANFVLWNQRDLLNDCAFQLQQGNIKGALFIGEEIIPLDSISGVFNRLSEIELTPEFQKMGAESPLVHHAKSAGWILTQWLELAPLQIMNRGTSNDSNSSKAFQAQLIRPYLPVPDTLVTNDADQVRLFLKKHGRVVYKSCSGERSIVTELDNLTLDSRSQTLNSCPVLFQQYIEGKDIRVHVVGSEAFATEITSNATDYRYDAKTHWKAIELPKDYVSACISLSKALDLELAGIDLRITPSGKVYCFEVNPSPAFSVYEDATGQPISDAIARQLMIQKS